MRQGRSFPLTINSRTGQIATAAALAGATAASMVFWQAALHPSVRPLSVPPLLPGFSKDVLNTPELASPRPALARPAKPTLVDRRSAVPAQPTDRAPQHPTRGESPSEQTAPSLPTTAEVIQPAPTPTTVQPAPPVVVTETPTAATPAPATPASTKKSPPARPAVRKVANLHRAEASKREVPAPRGWALGLRREDGAKPAAPPPSANPHHSSGQGAAHSKDSPPAHAKQHGQAHSTEAPASQQPAADADSTGMPAAPAAPDQPGAQPASPQAQHPSGPPGQQQGGPPGAQADPGKQQNDPPGHSRH
jgi:hypothetical protein